MVQYYLVESKQLIFHHMASGFVDTDFYRDAPKWILLG